MKSKRAQSIATTSISLHSSRSRLPAAEFLTLEPRLLLCTDHGFEPLPFGVDFGPRLNLDKNHLPKKRRTSGAETTSGTGSTTISAGLPLSSIPILNSNPNAVAQLYLDFDGDGARTWGSYNVPVTPAYSQDTDPTTFSDAELASIRQIWQRVAEKYSPFNINVTTARPNSFADRVALHVVIGGTGAWVGASYGGVGYTGGFYNSSPNVVYSFEDNLGNGTPKFVAESIAHESGHGFGLQHQSLYTNGVLSATYNPGNALTAPAMGNSYSAARGLWWIGTSTSASTIQDDLSVLASTSNGFGYRADDHSSTLSAATGLLLSGSSLSGQGIIEKMTDRDVFSFTTDATTVTLTGSVIAVGATLDLKLELYNSAGTLVASADTAALGETLTLSLPAGSYRLVVASHGSYGDVGQYLITGSILPPANFVAAPASLTAAVISSTQVNLGWTDLSTNETGFVVQRSSDNGATWTTLNVTASNVASYQDATAAAGVVYSYRVYAAGPAGNSDYSNTVLVTTVPLAPSNLVATAVSGTQINLTWNDVLGESSYFVERSLDGLTWTQIATTGANGVSYQNTNLTAATLYRYRVRSNGAAGASAPSNIASATTQSQSVPTAPTNVTSAKSGKKSMRVSWSDMSSNETGFTVQRSTDGLTWKTVGTLAANSTTLNDGGLRAGTYRYRVAAYNAAGSSAYAVSAPSAMGKPVASQQVMMASPTNLFSRRRIARENESLLSGS